MFRKSISVVIAVTFICTLIAPLPKAQAQNLLGLPEPGTMVSLSPAYQPALIKGLTIHKDNPFLFDFIVDTGNSKLAGEDLRKEGERLIKYFFASLTIPDKDLWVNLSPYEKDRMVPQALGQTAMGRDLLAQDYMLKQLTASLIYPEKALGKNFWDKVYAQAREQFGTTNIPINTFNKVWIVAEKASVYEHNQTAFVVSGHLKVMLEQDYLALQKHVSVPVRGSKGDVANTIIRQIILPSIENEVNKGQNFAQLRQIFYSQILATWFKRNLRQALLSQVYVDKSTVNGVNLQDPSVKEKIYERYLQAYKKGAYNYIKDEVDPITLQSIPKKYFSGGYENRLVISNASENAAQRAVAGIDQAVVFPTLLDTTNPAMAATVITQGRYSAELSQEKDEDGQRTVTLKHDGKTIFIDAGYIENIRFLNGWMLVATFYSILDPGHAETEFVNIFEPTEWYPLENSDAAMKDGPLAQWESDFRQTLLTMSANNLDIDYGEAEGFYQALAGIGPYSPDPVRVLFANDALAKWLKDKVRGIRDEDILILEARMERFFTGIKVQTFKRKIEDLTIDKLSEDQVMKVFSVYWTVAMGQADNAAMITVDSKLTPGDKVSVQGGSKGFSTGHLISHTDDEITILGKGNRTVTLHGDLTVRGVTAEGDRAAIARDGGIDLNTLDSGLIVSKDTNGGVVIMVDPAMIARVRQEGIQRATPVIIGMKYLVSMNQLLGL